MAFVSDKALAVLRTAVAIGEVNNAFGKGRIEQWEAEHGKTDISGFPMEDMVMTFALACFAEGQVQKAKRLLDEANIEHDDRKIQ